MRTRCITQKVATPFGGMFVHLEIGRHGRIVGGSISHKWKEPDSQLVSLVDALSAGLDATLAAAGGRVIWWRRLAFWRRTMEREPVIFEQNGNYAPGYRDDAYP